MSIKRRDVILGVGALTLAPLSVVHAKRDGVLRAADVHVDGYPTVEAVRFIGKKLESETGGRLRLRVYHAGQLGREGDTVDLARFGALDFTRVNFAPLTNIFPLTQIFALPSVFDSVEHMRRAVDGVPGRAVLKSFESRGLVGLAIYDAGSRSIYNTLRPIYVPKDLNGLKIRVPPSDIFLEMARALGANPTPLPYGEVYSAMQTRMIEGAENNWRTFHSSRQFEVARFWSGTHHSYSPEALLMSRRTFDELTPSDRELVLQTAQESVPYMRQLWDKMESESREFVIKSGVNVNEVDRDAFRRATEPVLKKYLGQAALAELYNQIQALAS